mgnify:CR=1 FL=1
MSNLSKKYNPKVYPIVNVMKVPYASPCDSFIYAMVATRPDIAHAMQVVSREVIKPTIRYLKGTKSKYICYGKGPLELLGFHD